MEPEPRAGILDIMPYKGGVADAPGFAAPVKLSSNENCLGASPRATQAYARAAASLERYPDGGVQHLREALAAAHDIPAAQIVCGNGSDEILQMLAHIYLRPGDEVLHAQNGFLTYKLAALQNNATPVPAPENDMQINAAAFLSKLSPKTRIVYLANPNNPTGFLMPADEVRALHAGLPENVLLVIDGAYAEYVRADDYDGGFGLVRAYKNVVATRTFSKAYGLAGLRIGWAFCPPRIADALNRIRSPFNANAPAQAAACAALDDRDFIEKSAAHVQKWVPWLIREINALGLKAYPSAGNFILIGLADEMQAQKAEAALMAKGLIVRNVKGFGLPGCVRMTVGLEDQNKAVVAALAAFLQP